MHTPLYTGNNHVQPFVPMQSCTLLTPLYVDMLIFDILFITACAPHSTRMLVGSDSYTLIQILG